MNNPQKKRSTRKTKPTYTINRKTLDTQHKENMKDIEGRRLSLNALKSELELKTQQLLQSVDLDETIRLKDRISDVRDQISALNIKNNSIQYFADTASILFRYYDLLEDSMMSVAPPSVAAASPSSAAATLAQSPFSGKSDRNNNNNNGPAPVQKNSILQYFGVAAAAVVAPTALTTAKPASNKAAAAAAAAAAALAAAAESDEDDEEDTQRGSLLDKYMECTDANHVKTAMMAEQASPCPHCGCEERMVMHNDGFLHCPKCATIEYVIVDHDKPSYKDPPKEISYYAYKRLNHFNEWLNQIQGKETTDIPDEVFDRILLEIKKQKIDNIANLSNVAVKNILKKLRINKYYEHVPHIINRLNGIPMPHLSVELEDKLRSMFKQIQAPFLKHSPLLRKNFLSYSYVLHKSIQLLGHDEYLVNFPLLKSREKLQKQDQIWCKICEELNWEFIKSL